jgi:hypothetical protein
MNPEVSGSFFLKNISQFLEDTEAIKRYNLVIVGSWTDESEMTKVSEKLWDIGVPCIFITMVGFFFYVRSQKQLHFVESSNTKGKKYYMRVTNPFPELLEYANKQQFYEKLEAVKDKDVEAEGVRDQLRELSNIPYILVLISVISRLPKEQHKRAHIQEELQRIRKLVHSDYRENIDQAITNVLDISRNPDNFMIDIGLLSHQMVTSSNKDSHPMAKFLYAANTMFTETGQLPQPTEMPDMHTTTEGFINLKNIYKQKHSEDVNKLCEIIAQHFGDTETDKSLISDYINNLHFLEIVEMNKYAQELQNPDAEFLNYMSHEKDLLIAIRSFQRFHSPAQPFTPAYESLQQTAQQLKEQYKIQTFD